MVSDVRGLNLSFHILYFHFKQIEPNWLGRIEKKYISKFARYIHLVH
jgi:hypothetical protein